MESDKATELVFEYYLTGTVKGPTKVRSVPDDCVDSFSVWQPFSGGFVRLTLQPYYRGEEPILDAVYDETTDTLFVRRCKCESLQAKAS